MPLHERAREVVGDAVAGAETLCVHWRHEHEFLAVVINPRIFKEPPPMDLVLDAMRRLPDSLSCSFPSTGDG